MEFAALEPIYTQGNNLKTEIKDKKDRIFINMKIKNSETIGVKALVKKIEVREDIPGVRLFKFGGHAKPGIYDSQYLVGSQSKRLKLSACQTIGPPSSQPTPAPRRCQSRSTGCLVAEEEPIRYSYKAS
jgi:hypothetical protein